MNSHSDYTKVQRNINMDALRVICAFLVVCIHTLPLAQSLSSFNDYTSLIWQTLSRPGLPIFFILSGYFILTKTPSDHPVSETINRCIKIIIPFMIFFGIHYFSISIATGKGWQSIPSYFELVIYGAHRQYGHLWFVYSILGIYILTPAINRLTYKLTFNDAATVIVILLAAKSYIVYTPAFARAGVQLPSISIPSIDTWLIYFISGAAIALSPKTHKKEASIVLLLSIIATAILITAGQIYKPYDSGINMYAACISATYLAHSASLKIRNNAVTIIITSISRHSYGIYLIHIFAISIAMNCFGIYSRMNDIWLISSTLVAIAVFVSSLGISAIIDRFICEKLIKTLSINQKSTAPQKEST